MQYDALKTEQQSLHRKQKAKGDSYDSLMSKQQGLLKKLDSMRKQSKAQDALMATNKKAHRGIKTQFEALKDERQKLQGKYDEIKVDMAKLQGRLDELPALRKLLVAKNEETKKMKFEIFKVDD